MGGRTVARSVPGAKTTNVVVPPSVIVILDNPAEADDAFTLISEKGKAQTKKTSEATKVDDTHGKLTFALKDNPKKPQKYKLVQKRGKKSKHTLFVEQPGSLLSMDGEKPPQMREKQYYPFKASPPKTSDPDLQAPAIEYGTLVVKEPDTSG
jgi:hypothetical protein